MRTMVADLRYGWRLFQRAPGFGAVIIVTLGVGIGMVTTMFTAVNGLLLTSLPYPDAERLVILWQGRTGHEVEEDWFSVGQYVDIRDGTPAFEETALAVGFGATLTGRGTPSEVGYIRTTSAYLQLLGASAHLGRLLDAGDDAGDATRVAVLSYSLWQASFGGNPDIVGETVTLDGQATPIVGVLSQDVILDNEVLPTLGAVEPLGVILSLPLTDELLAQRNREDYNVVARLAEDATLPQAQSQLDAVAARIQERHESDPGSGFFIRALTLHDEVVGAVRRTLVVLLAAVAFLLLIACVNVTNLVLSRAAERNREVGIRAAVGAGRMRIVRQLITESAVPAVIGGGSGILLAFVGVSFLQRVGASSLPRMHAVQVDLRVLLFALVVTGLATIASGLLPALRVSRVDLAQLMKQSGATTGKRGLSSLMTLSHGLVVAEIGLSLVLLIGAGLLARSLSAVLDVSPGFASEDRLSFQVQMRGPTYPRERRAIIARDIEAGLEAIPGVLRVGAVSQIPFGGNLAWTGVTVPGYVPPEGTTGEFISSVRIASRFYLDALSIPLLAGRTFAAEYPDGAPIEAIIDERIAAEFFADRDPIGRPIQIFGTTPQIIVGVAGSIRHTGLDEPSRYTVYLANDQFSTSRLGFVVHTRGDPLTLVRAAESVVHGVDPDLAVVDVATMEERIATSLASRRLAMLLLRVFAVVAALLAVIGVYGLITYRVSQAARELGMRMALGAQRWAILKLVLAQGMFLTVIGITMGTLVAFGVMRLMRSMLFDVSPHDTASYVVAAISLAVTAIFACLFPSIRATRLDPMRALRSQ